MRLWVEDSTGFSTNDGDSARTLDGFSHRFIDCTDKPMPSVVATRIVHYGVEQAERPPRKTKAKPPYVIPSMEEIRAIQPNGFKVISTFSGGGGSSLGYRLAGFKVVWANEFVPEAAATYRANHPDTLLDTRDIRAIEPGEILSAIGMTVGELDLFDGSPPCASFSSSGKREAGWGKEKKYSDTVQRTDDLFIEYARILKGLQPKAFVGENVSGLVKGVAKGYFLEILAMLKEAGYRVKAALLDASWLGVPQDRKRIIFIGVRNDLKPEPAHPTPLAYCYSIREALPWITKVSTNVNYRQQWESSDRAAPTITAFGSRESKNHFVTSEAEMKEADIQRFAIGKEYLKVAPGGESKKYFNLKRPAVDKPCRTITVKAGTVNAAGVCHPFEPRKFYIAELKRICSFPDDYELTGTFTQQWERLGRSVPPLMMQRIAATVRDEILRKL